MIKLLKRLMVKTKYIKKNNPCQENNEEEIKLDKISFKGGNYYIDGTPYLVSNLEKVEYGLAGEADSFPTCYIRVYLKEENDTLQYGGFEIIDLNNFIESRDEFNIPVLPTIIGGYPYTVKSGYILTIGFRSFLSGKGLIKINSKMIYKNNNFLEKFNLKKYLKSTSWFNDKFVNSFEDGDFNMVILDRSLTLNRGYGIYPILNDEIIVKDIFYSFDENEIKNKIIELFEEKK